MDAFTAFEVEFIFFLQEYIRTPILTYIMKFFTTIGNAGIIFIAACIILLIIKKYRPIGIIASVSLILNLFVVNLLLKPLVGRMRPYDAFNNLTILINAPSDYSFPSGHSSAGFAVAAVIFMLMPKKYGIPAIIIASIIAFSRLYLGVHYPSDVAAGIIIGCLTGICSKLICEKLLKISYSKQLTNN